MDKWMSSRHQVLFLIWGFFVLLIALTYTNTSHSAFISSKFSTLGLASVKFQYTLLGTQNSSPTSTLRLSVGQLGLFFEKVLCLDSGIVVALYNMDWSLKSLLALEQYY